MFILVTLFSILSCQSGPGGHSPDPEFPRVSDQYSRNAYQRDRSDDSIYAQESGGTALWTESHPDVVLLSGVYNVLLGSITPLSLLFDRPYYLGIQVGTDPEMTPRLPLSSVGYAYRAGTAEIESANNSIHPPFQNL